MAIAAHIAVLKGEPLRRALSEALHEQPGLGGQERRFAAFATRELSRHQRFLDLAAKQLGQPPSAWALREDQALIRYVLWRRLFTGAPWTRSGVEVRLPGPVRPRSAKDSVLEQVGSAPLGDPGLAAAGVEREAALHSFTGWMATRIAEGSGVPPEEVGPLLAALNVEPSLILRCRPPGTRAEVLAALAAEGVQAEPLAEHPDAARILDVGNRVFETRVMKEGRAQVQDLGSQLIVALCGGGPEVVAADICAGAGGKTLALADVCRSVIAGDLSSRRLSEARERVGRARLGNVRFAVPAPVGEADVVLIDAPCSGSGSLAREPDAKWRLNAKAVAEYQGKQLALLRQVGEGAKAGAAIVYATCSVFREENEEVVERFLGEGGGRFEVEPARGWFAGREAVCSGAYLRVYPHRTPGGGFFAARLRKRGGR